MSLDRPGAEHILRQLAQSTAELRHAAEAGDLGAAEELLSRREMELEQLQGTLSAGRLDAGQMKLLDEVVRHGAQAIRVLVARRETLRAEAGILEGQRQRLANWALRHQEAPARLDLQG